MSDDLDAILRTFELLDSDNFERALPLIDERFEMVTTAEVASEPDVYRGPEGVRRWWESFLEAMDYVGIETRRVHRVGEGRAVIEFVIHARGRFSGAEVDQEAIALATAAGGRVRRLEFFTGLEEALSAARAGD